MVRLLRGHAREVVELAAVPAAPRLLLSLSRDGNLRLWDVPSETCLSSLQTDASCVVSSGGVAHPLYGTCLLSVWSIHVLPMLRPCFACTGFWLHASSLPTRCCRAAGHGA